ncbi:PREDICTED: uncharacterized protein LOC107161447 [Diuraphis noxia]|uniref:uncharacterized protein LOC107161447 n=1 Tax=Diuraphis noxia TaxID=143948 RepID=UPI0007636532|nr:PREDICTED: uncharacterized protein LOC107161447 [Diuraphis noxia]
MFLIIFLVFAKYIPLYRLYHVKHCDNSTSNGNTENKTDSSPPIKSPISFLIVNFVYVYAIMIIIICFYGLYGWAAMNVIVAIEKYSKQTCNIENADNSSSDIVLISQNAEDDKLIPETIPLQILSETMESINTNNDHCTWVGDWNKY